MSIPVKEAHSGAFRSIPVIIRTGNTTTYEANSTFETCAEEALD